MAGKFIGLSNGKSILTRAIVAVVAAVALLLLVLLAAASANTEFFDRYYSWLYAANIIVAVVFLLIVLGLVAMIVARLRQGKFGTRLLAKLAVFFALVGVVPGALIYLVSYQFVSRSIESWFDVNVETALTAGLNLGRGVLDASLSDLQTKGRVMADQLASSDGTTNGSTLTLLRLRDQFGVQNAEIVEEVGDTTPGSTPNLRIAAQASGNFSTLVPSQTPTPLMLEQATQHGGYAAIEDGTDPDAGSKPDAVPSPAKGTLRLHVIQRIPDTSTSLLAPAARYLDLTQPVPATLARNADAVQRAYRDYQEKALGRSGLRKMYIGTLTLALFLATFIAMMIALVLGNQLARPLFLLAQGTKEVAEGDYTPKGEINSRDELGFLTQSFNAMTRQLAEARQAVESNRVALEHSKAYLESILANLTAGVFVLYRQFRLTMVNRGAERIFRQPFNEQIGEPLEKIAAVKEFGAMVRKAFAEREAAGHGGLDRGHWQQQFAVEMPGENEPLTLLVRGTRLLSAGHDADETAGYVVVFDDISDVISAQRSVAWGEVARRLAHEIKNPLTPIQLSAERLQMKLADKLAPADAEVLKRGSTTIVNQVSAMKRMVDDFREYARTPPVVLTPLQLNDLVSEVLSLYGAGESKSEIVADLQPLPVIYGDATQLRQVIHNLLQNAQDSVADLEHPRVAIETKTVEYGDPDADGKTPLAVRLTVSDNGPGFPARILTRAFEPYVTTKAKGTGLGLATVKKIIDEHGARIDLRNRMHGETVEGAQVSILFLQMAADAPCGETEGDASAASVNPASVDSAPTKTKDTEQTKAA